MKILFIGDMMCHDEQLMSMKFGDTYNFDKSFEGVRNTFYKYDYVVGNLETVLTDGPFNGFPKFSTPKQFCDSLIKSGVNVYMLANNHICDMGVNGVKSTIGYFENNEILYTGVGVSSKSMPVFIGDVAIINYTNKMNVKAEGVVYNDLNDFTSVKKDIEYAKDNGAKTIISVVHWGKEYETTHSFEQMSAAKRLIGLGVDAIIGSHPHVIQDITEIDGCPVVFSMGNFISSQIEGECMRNIGVDVEVYNGRIVNVKYLNFQNINDNGIIKVEEI